MLETIFCRSLTIFCISDQIVNLQNCFNAPNKILGGREPETDKHLLQSLHSKIFLDNDTFGIVFYQESFYDRDTHPLLLRADEEATENNSIRNKTPYCLTSSAIAAANITLYFYI